MPKLPFNASKRISYPSYLFNNWPSLAYTCLIISSFLISCTAPNHTSTSQNNTNEDFKILTSIVEDHVSGRQEGGRYNEYFFQTVILSNAQLRFDSFWVNNKALPAYVSKETNTISAKPITFVKGDTITIRVSELMNGDNASKASQMMPPIKVEGAALLGYTKNGIRNYQQITSVIKRELLQLPGGAPQKSNQK